MDYFNTPKERWQEFLNIEKEDIPAKLVIDGKIDHPKWTRKVLQKMTNGRVAWMPNLIIGEYLGELVGYDVCFGGPIASQFVHIYSKMGTSKMVQIGIGGGLQPDMELGDIIVSEGVKCLDGSARLYHLDVDFVNFDAELRKDIIDKLDERGIPYHVGKTICMFDILLWEEEDYYNLSRGGYIGEEMESGGVGSASKYFGVPAASFYVCVGNSFTGKDLFYEQTKEEKEKVQLGLDTVLDIALEL